MSKDKRAEIVEAMAREMLGRVNAPEQEIYRVAGDLADIALKAAAEVAVRNAHHRECADDIKRAILALTSKGSGE